MQESVPVLAHAIAGLVRALDHVHGCWILCIGPMNCDVDLTSSLFLLTLQLCVAE